MGETPERMTGFSVICNEFPSLLSSLRSLPAAAGCFAALYPFGANCLPGKFAQRAQISTDRGTDEDKASIARALSASILPICGNILPPLNKAKGPKQAGFSPN
jgi:hypothetical protein